MQLALPQIGTGIATLLPKAATAVFILLIAHSSANLTWRIVAPPAESALDKTILPAANAGAASERPDYAAQIARLHLFGEPDVATTQPIADAPETQLNLILLGVYATSQGDALAIISGSGAEEKVYGIGDEIIGGVTLEAVYSDRVILAHNQRNETLRLRLDENTGLTVVQPSSEEGFGHMGEDPVFTDFSGLGDLRAKLIRNPEQLNRLVDMQPVSENGQFRGYRIEAQQGQELFAQLGLVDGDIVTAVNDISLNRPEQGLAVLRQLVSADQVTVTVLRNGSEITLQHTIQ